MNYDTARLDQELAAYSPSELAELQDTVSILLAAVDDGSTHYHNMGWRIEAALSSAIRARLERAQESGETGAVVQFPGVSNDD